MADSVGKASNIKKAEARVSSSKKHPFWKTLFAYARPFRAKLIVASLFSFIVGGAVALQPMVIKFIVDEGINRPHADAALKFKWTLIYIGIFTLLSGVRIGLWSIGYRGLVVAVEGFLFGIRSQFFRHIQGLCFRFHDEVSSGELYNYIMGSPIQSIKNFLQQLTLYLPFQIVSWAVGFTTLMWFDWKMTLLILFVAGIIILINRNSYKRIKVLTATFMEQESSVSKYVADMLRGCREIKIHAIGDRVSDTFDTQIDRIRFGSTNLSVQQQLEYIKPEGIQYLGTAVIYAYGAYSCIYGHMTVGELFAFISSMGLLMGPVMMLFQMNLTKANAEAGLERIMRILDTETTVTEPALADRLMVTDKEPDHEAAKVPAIQFVDISFGYKDTVVLSHVNCTISRGTTVALVGPSGSGKSTFIRLLLRLYEVQQGTIFFNGLDITRYSQQSLRSHFGVVSQDVFLFQTTIAENVRVARPDASALEVQAAMDKAFVSEFVASLPQGGDTPVGENGYTLSGGQKQRIAIARAILGNPPFYIFDEATSALDNQSERRIQDALNELKKSHTVIIIAHRLSTIKHADTIFVFDKGSLVQRGTYSELASQVGLFETLLKSAE